MSHKFFWPRESTEFVSLLDWGGLWDPARLPQHHTCDKDIQTCDNDIHIHSHSHSAYVASLYDTEKTRSSIFKITGILGESLSDCKFILPGMATYCGTCIHRQDIVHQPITALL